MSIWDMLWLAVWALILFVVGSFGFIFGYCWRRFSEKKTITEAVKAVRDYEAVKVENDCLREVVAKRDKEIEQLERERKNLEECNEDMVPHNCKRGKVHINAAPTTPKPDITPKRQHPPKIDPELDAQILFSMYIIHCKGRGFKPSVEGWDLYRALEENKKKKVIDDEVRMQPVPKSFTVEPSEAIEGPWKVIANPVMINVFDEDCLHPAEFEEIDGKIIPLT